MMRFIAKRARFWTWSRVQVLWRLTTTIAERVKITQSIVVKGLLA